MTKSTHNYDDPFLDISEESQKKILELFAKGDLLTCSVSGDYYANQKLLPIAKENKVLKYTMAKYSLLNDYQLALFSDGTLVLEGDKKSKVQEKFIKKVQKDGFIIKNIEFATFRFLIEISKYAHNIYKDKLVEVELPDEKSFVDDLFNNNNVCISAVSNLIPFEARNFLALFSDGRFIVSNRHIGNKYNRDLSMRVHRALKKASNEYLIWDVEYVPDSYIRAIYQRAEKSENFLPPVETKKPENPELNTFLDKLFANNNRCVTIVDLDNIITVERDVYAMFEDGRFIVNEDEKHNASAFEFNHIAMKNFGRILTPEYVPAYFLPAIYERALKNQKSAKDIFIEKLKKKAKKMVGKNEIAPQEALEKIAVEVGFKNWQQICDIDEDQARISLGRENEKEYYLKMFGRIPDRLI